MAAKAHTIRLAALGDLHYGRINPVPELPRLLLEIRDQADMLLICGDLTDTGSPEEARALVKELSAAQLPCVAVLGNHDYHSGKEAEVKQILTDARIQVLDGDSVEVQGIGIAGVKGFAGGFGRRALGAWGEAIIKAFVHEALDEALKLEAALAKLRTEHRVVLMHYSPIQGTVEGEPHEIYPYLGSSRLEEPLSRFPVNAVFHGHAHHGSPEGRTMSGVPVYNVSMSLLQRLFPNRPPFRVVELKA